MLIGLFVSHDQNNKDGQQVRKAFTFQTKTNILHHCKCILLVKLLWHNQNYQLVLGRSRDWSLVIWLTAWDSSRLRQWPRSLRINLTDCHPNLVNSYDYLLQCFCWVLKISGFFVIFRQSMMPNFLTSLNSMLNWPEDPKLLGPFCNNKKSVNDWCPGANKNSCVLSYRDLFLTFTVMCGHRPLSYSTEKWPIDNGNCLLNLRE